MIFLYPVNFFRHFVICKNNLAYCRRKEKEERRKSYYPDGKRIDELNHNSRKNVGCLALTDDKNRKFSQ